MATKSITITNEAYEKLAVFKDAHESFSDVINRITGRSSLLEIAGILSSGEAANLSKHMAEMRHRLRKGMDKTAKDLQ